jgi:hypothetical protein
MTQRARVILVNPCSTRGFGNYTAPYGLLFTAINIHKTYDVIIIDQTVEKNWRRKLLEELALKPLCVGVTAMTGPQIKEGLEVAQIVKEHDGFVVWGGLHATLLPEQTLANPYVDCVVEGEGEDAFAELVEALSLGKSLEGIPGVWIKVSGEARFGGKRAPVDLDSLGEIPFHLIDSGWYVRDSVHGPAFVFYSSRGCPQRCTFCLNETVYESHWRAFSPERVLSDLSRLLKLHPHIRHVQFWDDNFFPSLPRAKAIAEGVAALDDSLTWSVLGAHVRDIRRMSDEYLAMLASTRLREVLIGAESGSQHVLDLVRKNFKVEEMLESNRRLGRFGIRPTYSFISGVPGETDDDIRQSVLVMFQLMKDNPSAIVGNIKPALCYPGTDYFRQAVELGFKPCESLEAWSDFVWGDYAVLEMPWVSRKRKTFLQDLYYYTVLLCPEYLMIRSRLFPIFAKILSPIARWRVSRLNFVLPLTARVMHWIQKRYS